jgi:hypothetical protein
VLNGFQRLIEQSALQPLDLITVSHSIEKLLEADPERLGKCCWYARPTALEADDNSAEEVLAVVKGPSINN